MKIVKLSWYVCCVLAVVLVGMMLGHLQADAPTLIISEVKVRNDTTGFDEYIELYNPADVPVSLNDYSIGYANTSVPAADQWFTRFVIAQGQLEPKHYYLLAKNEQDSKMSLAQKSPFTSLADAGGTLQLTDKNGQIIDELHWTAAVVQATGSIVYMPSTTAAKNQVIARAHSPQGEYVMTPAQWQLSEPSPIGSALGVTPTPTLEPAEQVVPTPSPDVLEISELLPNPAAPQNDESNEYIEIHNLSSHTVNLKDYKLQSGNNFTYSYTFPEHILEPDSYVAFTVLETHLLLSNSGGRARLLDARGAVVSETDVYDAADAGKAWAFIDDSWQWTATPTPGSINALTEAVGASKQASSVSKSPKTSKTSKPVAKSAAKPSKVVKASTKKAKTPASTKKSNSSNTSKNGSGNASVGSKLHPLVLAGVGLGTVVYGIYEYRQDIALSVRKLKGNRGVRRAIGSQAEGR